MVDIEGERYMRLECLKLAVNVPPDIYQLTEDVVARAKAYEDFVQGTASGVTGAMPGVEDITGVTDLMRGAIGQNS